MSPRRCPRCGANYEGEARFCAKDGSILVEVSGGGEVKKEPEKPARQSGGSATEVRKAVKPPGGTRPDRAGTLSSQILDSRYQVLGRLGEGGMSYVYEARELASGDSVAVKILSPKLSKDPSSVERLRREAGLAMRLEHPNVCSILRLGETEDGLIYVVMPYLRGELLSDREHKLGTIPVDEGLRLLEGICEGLHHAHQLNIIHRDLKPENIMLVPQEDGSDLAVVMDFGLAKENRAAPGMAKLTATGIILGTPEFMSPEQIRGKDLDARSDVYALAIVAFEMFTSQLPFQGRNAQEMMIARLRGKPIPLRQFRADLPAKLEKVLLKAMDADPNGRYKTAQEFGEALKTANSNDDGDEGGGGVFSRLKKSLS